MITRKKFIGILSIVLMLIMVMPLTVLADSEEEYPNIQIMTDEEVQEILISNGVNLDKLQMARAGLSGYDIIVEKDSDNGRIAVSYYTIATIVANEIGVQSVDLYEKSNSVTTTVISDYKDYNCFKKTHYGGFYYNTPKSGAAYWAGGTCYAILTTTRYNQYVGTPAVCY